MHFWQPAENFFVKLQNENEEEKFQTHSPFLSGRKQSVMFFEKLVKKFPQKSKNLLLTMQKVN